MDQVRIEDQVDVAFPNSELVPQGVRELRESGSSSRKVKVSPELSSIGVVLRRREAEFERERR